MPNSLPNISIGDFAEELIQEDIKTGGTSTSPLIPDGAAPNVPDISNIRVDESFVKKVTGEEKKDKPKTEDTKTDEEKPSTERLEDLLIKLQAVIIEAKEVLDELTTGTTTVGRIGVNMAGSEKKSKKKKKDKKKAKLYCGNMLDEETMKLVESLI